MIIQKYNLNMIPDKVPVMVRVSQYDQYSRTIIFSLYDGALEYEIPTGSTISVRGTKPDHTGFEYPCTFEGNEVSFDIEPQQTVLSGLVPSEIRITSNNEIVGSCNFIINVEPTPLDESTVISDTELPLIEEASQAAVIAQGAAARAEEEADRAEQVLSTAVKSVNNELPDAQGNVDVVALPDGGTAGQILTKQSSTDGDADWENPLINYEITGSVPSPTPLNADQLEGHPASYFATKNDLSLAQTNLADSETSPSTHSYSVGQYLVYNGQLYRVKRAISVGESLVVGTNIVSTSIGFELTKERLSSSLIGANTGYTFSNVEISRVGNIYQISADVTGTINANDTTIGNVESSLRPSTSLYGSGRYGVSGSYTHSATAMLLANGTIRIMGNHTDTGNLASFTFIYML